MLEYPESRTVAKQIKSELLGKTVFDVELGHTPHKFAFFSAGSTEQYRIALCGRSLTDAKNYGGIVQIEFGDVMLFLADGAYPRYHTTAASIPAHHQFLMQFTDGSAVTVSVQMYGFIQISRIGECSSEYYLSSLTKPDVLSDAFTYEYFRKLYTDNGKKLSAKAFLATEQRIPGLGNGVLQDILWNAMIDPRFDMRNMDEDGFRSLYSAIRQTIEAMCNGGGRSTERGLLGEPGGYTAILCKDTLFMPCMRCGKDIQKAAYMGGTIYFCSACQRR